MTTPRVDTSSGHLAPSSIHVRRCLFDISPSHRDMRPLDEALREGIDTCVYWPFFLQSGLETRSRPLILHPSY